MSKFAIAALALVASSASAQDCRTKEGQVVFLKGLISQWTLYKKQSAANDVLTVDQGSEESDRAARQVELEAHNTEKLANLTTLTAARKAAINAAAVTAAALVDTELATAIAEIDDVETAKTDAITAKATLFSNKISARVAKLNNKKTNAGNNLVRNQGRALTRRDNALASAQTKYDNAVIAATATQTAKNAKHTALALEKNTNNTNAETTRLAAVQSKYDTAVAALEASKLDADATLATIDNAGTTGLPFPADCLLEVADVIEEVKHGHSASEIWKHLITPGYFVGGEHH